MTCQVKFANEIRRCSFLRDEKVLTDISPGPPTIPKPERTIIKKTDDRTTPETTRFLQEKEREENNYD